MVYCKTLKICEPLIYISEFREFATIKGSENKYMYVWKTISAVVPQKQFPIYKLAKIKVANFVKLPISEIKVAQI